MWRLDVSPYDVTVDGPDGPAVREFDVKGSISILLFNPALQLEVPQAFEAKDLLDRINATDDAILLDKADMARLRRAYDAFRAPHPNALELLRRIRDAETVDVEATAPALRSLG